MYHVYIIYIYTLFTIDIYSIYIVSIQVAKSEKKGSFVKNSTVKCTRHIFTYPHNVCYTNQSVLWLQSLRPVEYPHKQNCCSWSLRRLVLKGEPSIVAHICSTVLYQTTVIIYTLHFRWPKIINTVTLFLFVNEFDSPKMCPKRCSFSDVLAWQTFAKGGLFVSREFKNLDNCSGQWYCWWRKSYCLWKKSCTTCDGQNPINNGINYLSTGAGFLPSTVLFTGFL